MIAGLYAGLAALFLIFLSWRVIGLRRSRKVSVGHQGDADLERAMRVQSNFVEYAPLALLLLYLVEAGGAPAWATHALGAGFMASRFVHFVGFRSAEAPGIWRMFGMLGTFVLLAVLAVVAIAQALQPMLS